MHEDDASENVTKVIDTSVTLRDWNFNRDDLL